MARPRINIDEKDWETVEELCGIFCTAEEISGVLKISVDTLDRRVKEKFGFGFADLYKNWSAKGKISLRRAQFKNAIKGNATLQIWLGKQSLGQTDKIEGSVSRETIESFLDKIKGAP